MLEWWSIRLEGILYMGGVVWWEVDNNGNTNAFCQEGYVGKDWQVKLDKLYIDTGLDYPGEGYV